MRSKRSPAVWGGGGRGRNEGIDGRKRRRTAQKEERMGGVRGGGRSRGAGNEWGEPGSATHRC